MITAPRLTLADLHGLRARYGGTIVRDIPTDTYRLVGTVIDGRRINLGPVPGPVVVEVAHV